MTAEFGGNVRHDPPYAERRFRHPGTGEEAVPSMRVVHPPGGCEQVEAPMPRP